MSDVKLPPCPPSLKQVQHYLKLASDYDKREPVVSYWSRLYALQTALKIDRKSAEARDLLTGLIDYLESFKKEHSDNESVTNDVGGQALVENVGHKLFMWADGEDRAARFNKNIVKVFYTAGLLFDVCEVFGELSEEVVRQRKYAKWKATYIHNCLKSGQTPVPGPIGGDDEGLGEDMGGGESEAGAVARPPGAAGAAGWSYPPPQPDDSTQFGLPSVPGATNSNQMPSISSSSPVPPHQTPSPHPQYSQPQVPQPTLTQPPATPYKPIESSGGCVAMTPAIVTKAQKYCKWAISALDYEDGKTAIDNLHKALTLLTTGQDT